MDEGLSRREFVARSALYAGAVWSGLGLSGPSATHAAGAAKSAVSLDAMQWRLVEAATARILPSDGTPGAREAHCVAFIDLALAGDDARLLPVYRAGCAGLESVARARFAKGFVGLEEAQQDTVLASLEDGSAGEWPEGPVASPEFFETLRAHTIIGFLADPKYGGNRGFAGWRAVGYPGPRHHSGGYTPAQMLGQAPIRTIWGDTL